MKEYFVFVADKEALTKGEHQTAVHYAAKTDSCASLKALIKKGCEYDKCRDYKGRTPLHLAAELGKNNFIIKPLYRNLEATDKREVMRVNPLFAEATYLQSTRMQNYWETI